MDGTDKTHTDAGSAGPAAKRELGADFEPGKGCPLDADGRMRWSQREADIRHGEAKENEQKYVDRKRSEE